MTCQGAQNKIMPYMDNCLNLEETEKFIHHIQSCSECWEELEIYYTLFTGMKLLDEQKNINNNFHMDLQNKLRQSEEQILQQKIRKIRRRILLFIIIVLCALLII